MDVSGEFRSNGFERLPQSRNNFSYWNALTQKTRSIATNTFKTSFELWDAFCHPNKLFFERQEGFWSKPRDEANNSFFTKLTERKSQRENCY